jgi:ABC-type transport system substrate-binding protein
MHHLLEYLAPLIRMGALFFLILSTNTFSQPTTTESHHDLIVGELIGKVDPDDLGQLIQSNYYPVIGSNAEIELDRQVVSEREVIFRVNYPRNATPNRPTRIIFRFYESEQSLIAAIITDEVDFAITESDEVAEEIDKSSAAISVHFRYKPPNFVKMLAYNNQHPLLKNTYIRKALTYAINRNDIFTRILINRLYSADGPLSHESKFHAPGLEEYKFTPRKAIQLLQSENWRDTNGDGILDKSETPLRIAVTYEKGVLLDEQLVSRIKIDWNKLGVEVIRNPLIKSEIKKRLIQKNYDVILMNHQFDETVESFESFFQSTSKDNILGYKNRVLDRYIDLYKVVKEPLSRQMLFQAIQHEINKDNPAAFLFFLWLDRYFVNRNKFTNSHDENGRLLPFTEWNFNR